MPSENKVDDDSSELETSFEMVDGARRMIVSENEDNIRLDAFLVKRIEGHSRARLQRAVGKGAVKVNGVVAKSSLRVQPGQQIDFVVPEPATDTQIPEDIPLDIIYEDDHLVAINKPPAMVVHPAKGHWSGTLTACLLYTSPSPRDATLSRMPSSA